MSRIDWSEFDNIDENWKNIINAEEQLTKILAEEIDKAILNSLLELNSETPIQMYERRIREAETPEVKQYYYGILIRLIIKNILKDHCDYEA